MYAKSISDSDMAILQSIQIYLLNDSDDNFPEMSSCNAQIYKQNSTFNSSFMAENPEGILIFDYNLCYDNVAEDSESERGIQCHQSGSGTEASGGGLGGSLWLK
ncbi:ethylene-responsive transcription factor 2-like [Abeliophyllum distichum]|uniref:Ethylene-responsive transcription factor 2-like n=1 Tax=Abeliophyllum distichum TaxID=126358 RepID=A0ABD1TFL4_9LAMI